MEEEINKMAINNVLANENMPRSARISNLENAFWAVAQRAVEVYKKEILSLPAKFWEDQDHADGGYISKRELKKFLDNVSQPKKSKE